MEEMPIGSAGEKKFWYLQNHRLFDQLSDDAIQGLCIISRYREARRGEHIFFTADTTDRIFILKHGAVKIVQVDHLGNEVVKDVLGDHDLFGHLPAAGRGRSEVEFAVALTDDVSICMFNRADFEQVLARDPQVSLKLASHIGGKLRALEQKYDSLVFKDVRTRLLEFLERYRELLAADREADGAVPNLLRQEDIAQLIGCTRQTVAELLGTLEREGLVRYSRRSILVR
ncbi:MAG TPA: Crp/Fnr family transcriptional regulator [Flavobacteriales bacterium]|nr:Crp/Fnr family transcriptional regulator [Flavobacteriales bacterium]HNU55085.1 Crp/Fnr family transcriptional regulator [Flavobacteriales bacterium]